MNIEAMDLNRKWFRIALLMLFLGFFSGFLSLICWQHIFVKSYKTPAFVPVKVKTPNATVPVVDIKFEKG